MAKYASVEDRFWSKVNKDSPVSDYRPDLSPCWLWTASRDGKGYGQFKLNGRYVRAHRYAYELLIGPIPEGAELDHLCRVRHCTRHDHLEPVTHQENARRGEAGINHRVKTCCPAGHLYDAVNTRTYKGGRYCLTCKRLRRRAWHRQRRQRTGVMLASTT